MSRHDEPCAILTDAGPAALAAAWSASACAPAGAGRPLLIACLPPAAAGGAEHPRRRAIATLASMCGAPKVIELPLPASLNALRVNEATTEPARRRVLNHILLDACAEAMSADLTRLIWPAIPGAPTEPDLRTESIADVCDRSLLAGQLASLDAPRTGPGSRGVRVETPYADFTDRQLAELLVDLGAPLQAAWWCDGDAEKQCGQCPSCRRWSAAFQRAGARVPLAV